MADESSKRTLAVNVAGIRSNAKTLAKRIASGIEEWVAGIPEEITIILDDLEATRRERDEASAAITYWKWEASSYASLIQKLLDDPSKAAEWCERVRRRAKEIERHAKIAEDN